jgi:hypothetical protein
MGKATEMLFFSGNQSNRDALSSLEQSKRDAFASPTFLA